MGPCMCIFIDQTVQRYETLDGNASFKLFHPMDREQSFICLDNGKINSNSKLLTSVHRETALACRNFLSGLLPFHLLIDPLTIHNITCSVVPIRSHKDFIDTLLKERPDISQRYRHVKGLGTFECNDKGVWRHISDVALLKIISDLLRDSIQNLNVKEMKWIGQVNQLQLMRRHFKSSVDDVEGTFQSKLIEQWLDEAVVMTDDNNDMLTLFDIASHFIHQNSKVKFQRSVNYCIHPSLGR
ncbi:hypothetical protein CEXT_300831 [Caerostris extrusa]|uniref:Guanylate cyclase n=1 Tax=Caerostris extrusa TaxID=172846 RepID=A0AAV4MRR4_CAEEX|nr:hypothetical protein CEXT_300831 [Caerostris extrusa]